jgi:hypothetical protein
MDTLSCKSLTTALISAGFPCFETQISRARSGRSSIGMRLLYAISEVTGISMGDLYLYYVAKAINPAPVSRKPRPEKFTPFGDGEGGNADKPENDADPDPNPVPSPSPMKRKKPAPAPTPAPANPKRLAKKKINPRGRK